ncbi:hypothetical protein OG618_27415 [Kitasatospora sp. NBC_01246]|uniref:hypothetical protein n=1 Tax=Kitasatospora sp. NBC_01246 TaxID=2903570 RepID=UPI002E2FC120|nr:hypothetical protein [Kitasatospora sp. NBC_01246]
MAVDQGGYMGSAGRPEFLPNCEVPARSRKPSEATLTCLVRLADESLADHWRTSNLEACNIRGGPALAAASFIVQAPGPWHEDLQRILHLSRVQVDRPSYSASEYTVGLCYVAGAKGLPAGLRHQAADALAHGRDDLGYLEARYLLPRNSWDWLADAVRDGWALWTAHLFAADETVPLTTRVRVSLALAEHKHPAGYVPEAVEQLVAHQGASSAARLALAVAVAQRAPKDAVGLLCCLASDPIVQAGHRMHAIGLLDEVDPAKAEEMRSLQTRLPSSQTARKQRREAVERAEKEGAARRDRSTPEAAVERLDSKIEELLGDLRGRGSADSLADQLDDHIAEESWEEVVQDVADICHVIRDEEVASSLRLLEVLTQIRYGNGPGSPMGAPGSDELDALQFPRLTQEGLNEYARTEAERAWAFWRELVEEHGWDDDQLGELDRQDEEVARNVRGYVECKTGDHLRELQQHLVWELWPSLADAAERRDYGTARDLLATAGLLADEAENALTLWKTASAENYAFDPLTMSWPREFWLVLEKWKKGWAAQ